MDTALPHRARYILAKNAKNLPTELSQLVTAQTWHQSNTPGVIMNDKINLVKLAWSVVASSGMFTISTTAHLGSTVGLYISHRCRRSKVHANSHRI